MEITYILNTCSKKEHIKETSRTGEGKPQKLVPPTEE